MSDQASTASPKPFLDELREQRWDDHRFYHRSRVNQTFHLISACCFLASYVLLFLHPTMAAIFGWAIAMWPRQIGHFFFEPKGFDDANGVSFEEKESIKVGFNLRRKAILFGSWLAVPVTLLATPSFFGLVAPYHDFHGYLHDLGELWLGLAACGLLGRTLYLCLTRGVQSGVVWFTKILTDPFHDIKIYHRAPLHILRGEWLEPVTHGGPIESPTAQEPADRPARSGEEPRPSRAL
jgi:hypothetical protein